MPVVKKVKKIIPSLADPRVSRTRKLLHDSLRSLLAERSLDNISVLDITEHATVNRATFYAHFRGKEELLASLLQSDLEEHIHKQIAPTDPFTAANLVLLTVGVAELLGCVLNSCPDTLREFENRFGITIQTVLYDFIAAWMKRSPTPPELLDHPCDAIATVLSWSLFGVAYRWARGSRQSSPEQAAREVVCLIFR